jgi:hypothetical protein
MARVNVHFREEQRFRQLWLVALLILPSVPTFYGAYQQLGIGRPFGNKPMPDAGLVLFLAGYLLFLIWFLSLKLVTEVRDDELYVKFVRLWRARRIPLDQIRSAHAVTYRPLFDFGGWGIRCGRNGMAYNVSGDRGVQLELANGNKVLVGSQRAEELARAIDERRSLLRRA